MIVRWVFAGVVWVNTFGPVLQAQSPAPSGAMPSIGGTGGLRQFIEEFHTDFGALERQYRLGPSDTRFRRLQRFYQDTTARLEAVEFERLDQDGKVDYLLLRNRLRSDLSSLKRDNERVTAVLPLLPFSSAIVALEDTRRRMEPLDAAGAAKTVTDLTGEIRKVRKHFEELLEDKAKSDQVPDKVVSRRASRVLEELRNSFKEWHDFHSGYHPEFTWWVEEAYQKAGKELEEYAGFIRKKLMGVTDEENEPLIGDPIGRAALMEALETEFVAYTPEELIEIANQEFAWCEKEMKRAEDDLGCPGDWKKAIALVSARHAPPGGQPKVIKELADESVRFIEDRGLVTIPELCKESWRMEMMSPARQKVNPYFTGGEVISVSYPTDTMGYEDKLMGMRGNNYHFSRATVQHELIPGHHLQGFMAERYKTYRGAFRTPFLVEGWALYWEMLLWDLNFPRNAEDRVGMLFWRSHRCARILFSLKYHLNQMTANEAVEFLVDRVGHERRNATAEVRRSIAGDYSPLYQAAYMLGGLQLRSLHRDLVDTKKMTDREFHDRILHEHEIPIDMMRALLTTQPLSRDYKAQWRFYELSGGKKPGQP
jgi:uncharacterized protein (DUF885 family)